MSPGPLLRAFAVMGTAHVVLLAIGVLRLKLVAIWLGPAGVGVLGLLITMQALAATLAGLGLNQATPRMVAARPNRTRALMRLLGMAALLQGGVVAGVIWMFQAPLAAWGLGDASLGSQVALVGLAIPVSLLAGAATGILQGRQQIATLARTRVAGSALGTAMALFAIARLGPTALPALIIAPPAATALIAWRVLSSESLRPGHLPAALIWPALARLGFAIMLGTGLSAAAFLGLRGLVLHHLDLTALGLMVACWTLAVTQGGLALSAMATDYYPRLSALMGTPAQAQTLIDTQTRLVLALAGPLLVTVAGWAPGWLTLFYTEAFAGAAPLLGWMALGSVLRLPGWALGFAMLAAGAGRWFLAIETVFAVVCLALTAVLVPSLDLPAIGIAFTAAYAAYGLVALIWARPRGLHPSPATLGLLLLCLGAVAGAALWPLATIPLALICVVCAWRPFHQHRNFA